ncbi:metallophosphoesterase family protein [Lacticaseibacillus jixianensis]|uniref:Metallophosphoesterase family protein n=1 Tax=Lacticaseibacillus jixianensis TaxID=2486012 RepID=A0ABW4B7E3_9LACO|nr:metallophosphoesterase family protein [Lacticaseibacillus jixianensis]
MKDETIAVMADVHGNQTALEAVLADAHAHGATQHWFLGDLFLPGPADVALIRLLTAVHPEVWLNGNWELDMYGIMAGHFRLAHPGDVYVARLTEYACQHVSAAQWATLKAHPIAAEREVNGLTIGAAHNERTRAGGRNLYPAQPQANFDQFVPASQDLAVYGHTHQQLMRPTTSGQLVINPGAVGQPYSPWHRFFADQRAHYALLHIDRLGRVDVEFRKVAYDIQKELQRAARQGVPYLELYRHLRETGETSTHDLPTLARVNAAHGYAADVDRFYPKHD